MLEVNRLTKMYGKVQALKDVSFSVKNGSSYGLLGPNGAGKSTTMKILTGVIKANKGSAKLLGKDVSKDQAIVSKYIGYVPQEITLYEQLSAYDNLIFFGQMYGMQGNALKKRVEEVLIQTGLADRGKDAIKTFSGGMKRRINIGAALLHRPKLLILDEPTVGIDPQSRNHIFDMIRDLNRQGTTIIYSTHYMEEVEVLCDEIAIIDEGSVKAQGPLGALLEEFGKKAIYLEVANMDIPPELSEDIKVVKEGSGWILETEKVAETMKVLLNLAAANHWEVKQLEIVRPSLENVFLRVTGTALRD
nr:ABC transporter ATP-binding protein [Pullulanibacillus pueri]